MKIISTLISITALTVATSSAWAAGTAAGTPVDNTASISYSVGTTSQTPIASSPTGNSTPGTAGTPTNFVVDKKIDLSVTSGSGTTVFPNSTGASGVNEVSYTLTNEGNSTEYFNLNATQVAGDNFDATVCTISAPATVPVQIVADANTTVTVRCNIPDATTVSNGDTSDIDMRATAVTDSGGVTVHTESAGDTVGVDVVLADDTGSATDAAISGGNRNASHSAVNTYTVSSSALSVQKTSAVTKMSINGADDLTNPMRIPGSTIEYTIQVSNGAGTATATSVQISDTLPATLTYIGCSVSGSGISSCSEAASVVTSDAFSLTASQTATLVIEATVN